MATIDDKVVSMSFDSSKFEQGVHKTVSALDKLKAALHFPNAGKGLNDINAAAKKVDLGHISKGIDDVKNRLGALRLTAIAVFSQIAMRAVAAGTQFLKAFTLDPIKLGFQEYATNLNAVQTILANTQAAGVKLKDVNRVLAELNEYSDKTIYNFSQMARNIGTFTAAGVELDVATGAIKGIANLAALSGSNAEQASTAMYQLSQAIAAGSVKLQDWNSVVNAGMGGTVFQRALAQTAEAMGTLEKGTVKLEGPMKNVTIAGEAFRQSLSTPGKASWLTSDVLTATLEQFTSDLTDAELAAMGFNKAQIAAIQQTAKTAMLAATEVKTLSQVLEVAKETAGSGWAKTWQIIFGDFGEAKKTFTALSNAINGFINANADARNKVLGDWKELGGRTVLIDAIKTAFSNLSQVLKPIKQAFRDIFPAKTGKDLYNLTLRFSEFAKSLKPAPETVDNLRRTFRGLFALLDIGKQIIGGIFGVFGRLFGVIGKGTGGFLEITASIGDFLVKIDQALKKGGRLENFFDILATAIAAPVELIGALISSFDKLFSGGFSKQMGGMTQAMTPFQKAMEGISNALDKFLTSFSDAGNIFEPVIESIVEGIQQLGPAVSKAISGMSFEPILQVIRVGLLGGIFVLFKRFLGKGAFVDQLGQGFGQGILGNIAGSFDALQGSLKAMQTNVKADTLKKIAVAVALLALSIVALSMVKPEKLDAAMSAITIAFAQLLGAMYILQNVVGTTGFLKIPFIAASLILLAGAINVLSVAVIALSFLSWEQLAKGLGAVGVLLGGIVAATGPLSKASPRMIVAGAGIAAIAVALNILALAVRQFGGMSMATLGKGLGAVAAGLAIIAGAMRLMPKGMVAQSAALVVIATSLIILAQAVEKLGLMDWQVIGKGMGSIAAGLLIIAGAMRLMPKSMIITASGLVIVATALQGIVRAVENLGAMSIEEIARGLGALAGSLGILAGGLHLMAGTGAGAAALGLAATGLALLIPPLILLGKQKIKTIVVGLAALAAVFAVISLAGKLMAPTIPVLLGFGAALVLIGAGIALVGAGIALIGVGLAAIAASGSVAVGVLIQAFIDLQKGLIENAKLLVLGLLEIVQAFADAAPQFVDAVVKILSSMIDALIQLAPKMVPLINAMIDVMLQVLQANQGRVIQAGFDLLIALLVGIRNNITEVVRLTIQIIQEFVNGIVKNINKIVDSGVKLVTAFLKGIANGISKVVTAALGIITKFLSTIASNLGRIVTAGLNIVISVLRGISNGLGRIIKAGTDIIVKFIQGIGNAGPRIISAATDTIIKLMTALQQNANKMADAGFRVMIAFLNGLADTIEKREGELLVAGARIGKAIVQGIINGIGEMAGQLYNKAESMVKTVKDKLEFWKSPPDAYGKWLGQQVVLGLAAGLTNSAAAVYAAGTVSQSVIKAFTSIFQTASPSKVMYAIGRDVIAGFALGLKSGVEEDIKNAFAFMNQQLAERLSTLRRTIREEKARLRELRKGTETKEETAEINALTQALAKHEQQLIKVTNAQKLLKEGLKENKAELIKHAQDWLDLAIKVEKVKEVIADLKDQYDDLPEIPTIGDKGETLSGAEQLKRYTESLTKQVEAVKKYNETLQQLRALGLDDATYKMLLEKGTSGQAFAEALLQGGKPAIDSINVLDTELEGAAGLLGENAAANLYNAGIKAAEGLVAGLESQMAELEKIMDDLADRMVDRIKKKLKVKSPSEVFAELGRLSMRGLVQGFEDSSQMVTDAVDEAAQNALTAMERSMRDISDIVTDQLDVNPVITPILDLSQVEAKQSELAALTAADAMLANVSSGYASAISASQTAAEAEQLAVAGGTSFKFEQNNYSPEALSNIEIYRQTKNQISQLKSALALT